MADIREQDLALKTTIADTDWMRLVTPTGNHRMTVGQFKDLIGHTQLQTDVSALKNEQIESGSNANGFYWKFPNGLLICYQTATYNVTFTPRGNVYGTNVIEWTYPMPFYTLAQPFTQAYFRSLNGITTDSGDGNSATTASFSFQRATSYTNNLPAAWVTMVAVGRWK